MVKILEARENGSQGTKLVKNETCVTNSNKIKTIHPNWGSWSIKEQAGATSPIFQTLTSSKSLN